MMTTNLSRSQPMAMPWNDDIYFFKPVDFESFIRAVSEVGLYWLLVNEPPR